MLDDVAVEQTGSEWLEAARDALAHAGHQRGAARERVLDLLARRDCALSAQEVEDALRGGGRRGQRPVARASIYRVLDLLNELGLVTRLDVGDGTARYERSDPAGEHHHHHLLCDGCGRLVPFDDPGLERSIARLSRRLGFTLTEHEVTLRGECPACR